MSCITIHLKLFDVIIKSSVLNGLCANSLISAFLKVRNIARLVVSCFSAYQKGKRKKKGKRKFLKSKLSSWKQ